ncbi:hypothetical protein GQ44DRAFT_484055 [Phaeosphaeriaceae sp. PMI808]|nr:hypothetical protein GQ44DRAFT_484055 [Phaeosphaeriaceae sp. PMI808]
MCKQNPEQHHVIKVKRRLLDPPRTLIHSLSKPITSYTDTHTHIHTHYYLPSNNSTNLPQHHANQSPRPNPKMCFVLFTKSSCPCSPVPANPYLRLCTTALARNPVVACPQGMRRSCTFACQGPCDWCRQCAQEKRNYERREWRQGRCMKQGMGGQDKSRSRE